MTPKPVDLVCQQVVELVNEYLGHTLTDDDRRAFDAHLETCPPCTTYLEQIRTVLNLARSLGEASPTADVDRTAEAGDRPQHEVEAELLAMFQRWCDKSGR
jgi:anti-sigma factor RsiW